MRRFFRLAACAALVLGMHTAADAQPNPPTTPVPAPGRVHPDPDFTVVNNSGRSIFFVRIRPQGAAAWGEDLLGTHVLLRDGGRLLVRPPRDGRCTWDVQVQFDNQVESVIAEFPVCRFSSLTIAPNLALRSGTVRAVASNDGTPGTTPTPQATPQAPPQAPAAPVPRLRVTNGWRVTLATVQARPPGRPDADPDWGSDLLGREVVEPQESLTLHLREGAPCRVDIRVGFEMPNAPLFMRTTNVDLCAGGDFTANGPPPGTPLGTGTGFFVSTSGHVATNQHVVHGCGTVAILRPDGQQIRLRLLQNDPRNDLALLQLPGAATPAVRFRDPTRPMRQGEQVLTMGYPLGSRLGNQVNINTGILAAMRGPRGSENRFTLSAPLNGGNSGGPIFDDAGLVVGVAVAGFGGEIQNVNFGIPERYLLEMLRSIDIRPETVVPQEPVKPADLFERNAPMVMQLGCFA